MSARITAVLTTAVLAVLAWVAPAGAADPVWPVQGPSTITIDGKGFGHGKGLSQYGALGAAQHGLPHQQILKFYYPGTRWGTASGRVKVLIARDTSRDVVVGSRDGLTVRSLGTGRTWTLPARRDGVSVKRWRITPRAGHRSEIAFRTGSWHAWRVVAGDAQFAAGGKPIRLFTPAGPVEYRGTLRSASPSATGLDRDTVNILPLDSYLKGVVPREVPALWPGEAVKAQAVAARTYAAHERAAAPGSRHYQICDTSHCQVFGGYSAEYPESNAAVAGTSRRVLMFGGRPAFTQFSASNGGYSVAGDYSYLQANPDPYDHYNPWRTAVTDTQIENAYKIDDLNSISITTRDGNGEWGGRAETITLGSAKGTFYDVTGESFRQKLGLRSTLFTISSVEPAP